MLNEEILSIAVVLAVTNLIYNPRIKIKIQISTFQLKLLKSKEDSIKPQKSKTSNPTFELLPKLNSSTGDSGELCEMYSVHSPCFGSTDSGKHIEITAALCL